MKKEYRKAITISMSPKLYEEIKAEAARRGNSSISELIRRAVRIWFQEEKDRKFLGKRLRSSQLHQMVLEAEKAGEFTLSDIRLSSDGTSLVLPPFDPGICCQDPDAHTDVLRGT